MILEFLNKHLLDVEKPSRYIGGEYNQVLKDPGKVKLRFVLAFPDVYEIGMSNLGLMILYRVLNKMEEVWCERTFLPWKDMYDLMKQKKIPLFTLESKTFVKNCDVVGISLQYELSYTNVLHLLDLAQIPIRSFERRESDPLVIAGGPCTLNPEVMAEVFDAMVIGEGEEVIRQIANVLIEMKGASRFEKLKALSQLEGLYVPMFYEPTIPPKPKYDWVYPKIFKRTVQDLNEHILDEFRIVPHCQTVHDRIVVEIMRGCNRGCRFCQAGIFYRPVREKFKAETVDEAMKALFCTGYEELALLSLSTADHSKIVDILTNLNEKLQKLNISLSIPSTRLDAFGVEIAKLITIARRTGLTFAPEAGTQRLRNVINKNVTQEDYLNALKAAKEAGWDRIKLYFMVGLPTETDEDLEGIVEMVNIAKKIGFSKINVSVASFVPKPHTPFQFAKQMDLEYFDHVKKVLSKLKRIASLNIHDPRMSLVEGLLSRGDRKIFNVVFDAFKNGAIFDNWEGMFNFEIWVKAIESSQIDLKMYMSERELYELLPWDHIQVVSKEFLISEYLRALRGEVTPDCRWSYCSGCGICNGALRNILEVTV
ncbi:TIGR03960 family B12-binding radical SAM protein [Pseudothermotoga thermarum]|uniref:Radical SAM domain protein n=1 Tax=Pseudothermotoga thermarum DSM 5069 TaxID=688269 RepID=F7YWM9_9THEM|nr:TIGR03960 family B12-binding radical SAM protein [Pseudothermotoga thermarum]AEH52016.1 Radical SAM domain protein [Pseudothermotoga thermarum DSM 5069]